MLYYSTVVIVQNIGWLEKGMKYTFIIWWFSNALNNFMAGVRMYSRTPCILKFTFLNDTVLSMPCIDFVMECRLHANQVCDDFPLCICCTIISIHWVQIWKKTHSIECMAPWIYQNIIENNKMTMINSKHWLNGCFSFSFFFGI